MDLNDPFAQQNAFEFRALCDLLYYHRPETYLEIGSCLGHSLEMMLRKTTIRRAVAVDLGRGAGPLEGIDTGKILEDRAARLNAMGYDVSVILGDSQLAETRDRIAALMKGRGFDLVFIDGDHSFGGVARDFALYARLAPIVALHDVACPKTGVPEFWQTIKGDHRHIKIHDPRCEPRTPMGIGVIFR